MWETLGGIPNQTMTTTGSCGAGQIYVWITTASSVTTTSVGTYSSQLSGYAASQLYNSQSNWDGYAHRDWLAAQRLKQAAELDRHAEAAKERARGLLLENLNSEQRETFEKNGWFVVEGSRSKKQYRIGGKDGHVAANIEVLAGDGASHRLCGHCDVAKVPLGDHLLAQKLMLESAEDEFIRIANRHAA